VQAYHLGIESPKRSNKLGPNPLDFIATGKVRQNALQPAKNFLFERLPVPDGIDGATAIAGCNYTN
jgi:hypothetical protein